MANPKPQFVKPTVTNEADDKFKSAAAFAASTKKLGDESDLVREGWDTSESTKRQIKEFVASSRKFKNKREFLEQCVRDGLSKYKNQ